MERAHEDLATIRRIMEESRREVVDRGKHFLIWGVLATVALVWTYLFVQGAVAVAPQWVWVAVLVVGWVSSAVVGWQDRRRARVRTVGRRLLSAVWVGVAVTLTAIGVAGMFGGLVDHRALPGLISVVMAAPILVTALLTGQTWLGWVAGGWWLGGTLMLFLPGTYALLLMAGMSAVMMALPGAILYARSRHPRPTDGPIADAT